MKVERTSKQYYINQWKALKLWQKIALFVFIILAIFFNFQLVVNDDTDNPAEPPTTISISKEFKF
jgi:hypothetical protein